jgi:3',5'-cyclic AMP phosphodiesterase CpdA
VNRLRFLHFLLCVSVAGAAEPWYFIQMSDPQFGMYTENRGFAQETINFDFAIATANRLRPAFVVVTGDLVNQAGNASQAAEYHRIAGKLDKDIPIYSVAGNHDVGNEPTARSLAAYREKFGRDYYTFRHGSMEGIVLDSSLIQKPVNAPEEAAKQEQWLKTELDKAQKDGVEAIVFQHIPYFLEREDEPDQYFNVPTEIRKHYLDLLRQYHVRYVFAGHYHRNAGGEAGGLQMITTGPVGMPLDHAQSGFRIAKVSDGAVEQRYFQFGEMPPTLEKAFAKK